MTCQSTHRTQVGDGKKEPPGWFGWNEQFQGIVYGRIKCGYVVSLGFAFREFFAPIVSKWSAKNAAFYLLVEWTAKNGFTFSITGHWRLREVLITFAIILPKSTVIDYPQTKKKNWKKKLKFQFTRMKKSKWEEKCGSLNIHNSYESKLIIKWFRLWLIL